MEARVSGSDRLASALASRAMARLVRYFAVNPDAAPHGRALERIAALSPSSLKNEVDRLVGLGLLVREGDGRRIRYRANDETSLWSQFRALVRQLSAPADVLPFALSDVDGVEAAFIFGSFAKGSEREDSDVDVMVVGDAIDEDALARHALEASVLLGREVNVVQARPDELRPGAEARRFFQDVLRGPKQWLLDRGGWSAQLQPST